MCVGGGGGGAAERHTCLCVCDSSVEFGDNLCSLFLKLLNSFLVRKRLWNKRRDGFQYSIWVLFATFDPIISCFT